MVMAVLLLGAPTVFAHHGLARFDTTHIVTMKGTITRFEWINPHAYVYADIDQHGKKNVNALMWRVERISQFS